MMRRREFISLVGGATAAWPLPARAPMLIKWAILIATHNCLGVNHCLAQVHPDTTRYEYLFMDGRFVAPYTAFPSGRDRGQWKCFDGKTKIIFNCTFVRGGFDQFQYIFRSR